MSMLIDGSTPARLKLTGGTSEIMELRRSKPEEAESFERISSRLNAVVPACAAAKKCFEASCSALGNKECDFSKETDGTSLHQCEATIGGLRILLERMKKPIPPECAAVTK